MGPHEEVFKLMAENNELSSGYLSSYSFTDGYGDVSDLMWPSYRRVTSARGGDGVASFSFKGSIRDADLWLEAGIGQAFQETYGGVSVFSGRLHEVRVVYPRTTYLVTLDQVANKVAVWYTSVVTNEAFLTQFYEDPHSIRRWGTRYLLIRPSEYMSQSEAEGLAQEVLARVKEPRIQRGPVRTGGRSGSVKISLKFQGWSGTLDADRIYEPTEGSAAVSTQITDDILPGSDHVEAGIIEPNATVVSHQTDYKGKLQRIHGLARRESPSGDQFYYGCFGDNVFHYRKIQPEVRYRVRTRAGRVEYLSRAGEVADPLVVPGGYSFDADTAPARPYAGLEDFRVQWDERVEYGRGGAILRGENWNINEIAQSLAISIIDQALGGA